MKAGPVLKESPQLEVTAFKQSLRHTEVIIKHKLFSNQNATNSSGIRNAQLETCFLCY